MDMEFQLEACTLQVGEQVVKPKEIYKSWQPTHRVGNERFGLIGDSIQRLSPTSSTNWTARLPGGLHLHWLGAEKSVAYLTAYKIDENGQFKEYESPPKVHRLDLVSGRWLADLPASGGAPNGYSPTHVLGVLTWQGGVIVLSRFTREESKMFRTRRDVAYVLRHFNEGSSTPTWTNCYTSAGERNYTGGYLWGVPRPEYACSSIQRLSWVGERLLVCCEALEPIRCLNPDTGTEIWQSDRVWEFQRGFVGPSVWSHFLGRFGLDSCRQNEKEIDKKRKVFNQQYDCAIVGGPVAVPLDFIRGQDTHSIFVTVVKGPAGSWSGYLSDCSLYEIGNDGEVISMVSLPQVVDGSRSSSRADGVVWKCQNNTFLKINPSPSAPRMAMGGGGVDGISNLAWTRRIQYREPKAWFIAEKAADPVAFGDSHAFCLPAGGYVTRKNEAIYHFPITALDLATGLESLLVLNVPFREDFSLPTNNFSIETSPDGTEIHRTTMFHLLAVTHLEADGHELKVTIAAEKESHVLKFDMAAALNGDSGQGQKTSMDKVTSARAQARLVDPKDLNESLAQAAEGNDVELAKALLEAGADPNYASNIGWTALMTAAAYGTADMVDGLIAAGSDVNAADRNCGGQTVLMWAARSGRETKRKLRSLLKAGLIRIAPVKAVGMH